MRHVKQETEQSAPRELKGFVSLILKIVSAQNFFVYTLQFWLVQSIQNKDAAICLVL